MGNEEIGLRRLAWVLYQRSGTVWMTARMISMIRYDWCTGSSYIIITSAPLYRREGSVSLELKSLGSLAAIQNVITCLCGLRHFLSWNCSQDAFERTRRLHVRAIQTIEK